MSEHGNAECWRIYVCPEHRDWISLNGGAYCPHYHGYVPGPESLPNRVRRPPLVPVDVVDGEWETAAKGIAVGGAAQAAWTGEAKAGLERILDLTTSEEIREIASSLLDLETDRAA